MTLNCIEMTLKLAQFCDDPKKISTKSSYPKKILIFLKTQKNIEIQNFEPKKMGRAYVCVKISEYPPHPPPTPLGLQTAKVSKVAKIRNRYNQVPHLTQDTNGKVTNSQKTPQTRAKRSYKPLQSLRFPYTKCMKNR